MEVILTQDLKNLGNQNEVVKVRSGYGRNYLIPKGLAVIANESNKKMLNETIKQRAYKEDKFKNEAQQIADRLKDIVIKVGAKVGESGKIFGSVNALQLSEALKLKGFNIDRKLIFLEEEHIKSLGNYSAQINLHKEIKVKLNFEVIAE